MTIALIYADNYSESFSYLAGMKINNNKNIWMTYVLLILHIKQIMVTFWISFFESDKYHIHNKMNTMKYTFIISIILNSIVLVGYFTAEDLNSFEKFWVPLDLFITYAMVVETLIVEFVKKQLKKR